jgi:hypothetical protein
MDIPWPEKSKRRGYRKDRSTPPSACKLATSGLLGLVLVDLFHTSATQQRDRCKALGETLHGYSDQRGAEGQLINLG